MSAILIARVDPTVLHGHTIALSQNLIRRGRVRDAARMLGTLPLEPADAPGVVWVKALLARIRVFEDDAPHLGLDLIDSAVALARNGGLDPWTSAQVYCAHGWALARTAGTGDRASDSRLRSALFSFDVAARKAVRAADEELRSWCALGASLVWVRLGEPLLAAAARPDPARCAPQEWVARVEAWLGPASTAPTAAHSEVPESPEHFGGAVPAEPEATPWAGLRRRPETPVVLFGERGTGKSALARRLHAGSPNSTAPFHELDARRQTTAEVEAMLASLASTPETASSSSIPTLFVNAPSALPHDRQAALAELALSGRAALFWAEREPPEELVRLGRLDPEFARAAYGVSSELHPLRERRAEVLPLIEDMLDTQAERAAVTPEALRCLVEYDWPGNTRQLRNEIDRAVELVRSEPFPVIGVAQLSASVRAVQTDSTTETAATRPSAVLQLHQGDDLEEALARAERDLLCQVLREYDGNVSASADALGLSRQGLYKKMRRLEIEPASIGPEPSRAETEHVHA